MRKWKALSIGQIVIRRLDARDVHADLQRREREARGG